MTKKQLYELLEKVSGLLDDPEDYGMRSFYAMPGTPRRTELIKEIDKALEPHRKQVLREYESAQFDGDDEMYSGEFRH